jgi:hypothetical protein
MKNILILIVCWFGIISCSHDKQKIIKQIPSNQIVTLYKSYRNSKNDSINLDIPIEFILNVNKLSNLRSFSIYYYSNNKSLQEIIDYKIYDKKSKKTIYAIEELKKEDLPNQILIRGNNSLISTSSAENLFKKYKINKSINSLKFGDTVKLVPYKIFKKDNNSIINELKKIDDSIVFRINIGKEDPILIKKKIDW